MTQVLAVPINQQIPWLMKNILPVSLNLNCKEKLTHRHLENQTLWRRKVRPRCLQPRHLLLLRLPRRTLQDRQFHPRRESAPHSPVPPTMITTLSADSASSKLVKLTKSVRRVSQRRSKMLLVIILFIYRPTLMCWTPLLRLQRDARDRRVEYQ